MLNNGEEGGQVPTTPFSTIEEAIADLRQGRMVVVCDDEGRENEGDLTLAAQFATPEAINFMAKEGRGLICLAITPDRCDQLGLDLMTARNESRFETAFTVSIEARQGVTTGISAADRAHTIQVAIDPGSGPSDIVQPGHVFPIKARVGGVLERAGQTEAAVDLARLAGLIPAGVICEVMNDDGTMARVDDLVPYCARHGLKMITVAELIAYRRAHDVLVERVVETRLPTGFGEFTIIGYRSLVDEKHHVALVKGEVAGAKDVLVRVHSECMTGDTFHSLRCDCGEQLESSLAMIEAEGRGVFLYLAQEGRGIGLLNKLRAYRLQDGGLDTVDANLELGLPVDLRDYGIGAQILADLGLSTIRLLTNNPKKIHGVQGFGLEVSAQVPIVTTPNPHNERYLRSKAERMGHIIHHQGPPPRSERSPRPLPLAGGTRVRAGVLRVVARRNPPDPGRARGGARQHPLSARGRRGAGRVGPVALGRGPQGLLGRAEGSRAAVGQAGLDRGHGGGRPPHRGVAGGGGGS
jgi:3,4-dihydroxy 2-butanone 4-phosphate synthase/GTP cyclohydrolase II